MARAAKKLTKRDLDALRARAEADQDFKAYVADAGQPGLYVWARRGKLTFTFEYRAPVGGRRRRSTLDNYGAITLEQARKIGQDWRGKLALGVDPQEDREAKRRASRTVADVVTAYVKDLEQRVKAGSRKPSSLESARRRLNSHAVPALGRVPVAALSEEQVRRWMRGMADTPVEANRTWTHLKAAFNWAHLDTSAFRADQRFAEKGRRDALDAEQLRRLGDALHEAEATGSVKLERKGGTVTRSVHASAVLAVRLLALTGFRRGEVIGHGAKNRRLEDGGLRWGDVDLKAGLVRLRESKTGDQVRVLGAAAIDLLRRAKPAGAGDGEPVCPGEVPGQPLIGLDKARRYLYERAGLAGVEGIDLHSLRHTFASIGAHVQGGRYVGMVAPLLGHGHQARSVTERYITSNPEALRPAADAIAGEIARLLGLGERGRVVEFPRGKGKGAVKGKR